MQPLPLKEHERVQLTIASKTSWVQFVDANTLTYHFQPHPLWGSAYTQLLQRI